MGSAGLTGPAQAEEQQVALGHKALGSLSCLSSQNLTLLLFQTLLMDRTWPRSEADSSSVGLLPVFSTALQEGLGSVDTLLCLYAH